MKGQLNTNTEALNNKTYSQQTMLGQSLNKIRFEAVSLCGVELPGIELEREELLKFRDSLISQGLLNEEDDLIEEIKCGFYKQMVHGVICASKKNTVKVA